MDAIPSDAEARSGLESPSLCSNCPNKGLLSPMQPLRNAVLINQSKGPRGLARRFYGDVFN